MARRLYRDEWFYELAPTALSESEFESILIQNTHLLRPSCRVVPFKKTVFSPEASARADLVLIADDYRYWSVIEVEMSRHSLAGHVIPQIRTLKDASYSQEHAAYLAVKNAELDPQKLSDMFRGEAPDILVIVNKHDSEWEREISRYGAHMIVFEIFRSDLNRHIFSIDGEVPRVRQDILTELALGFLSRMLVVRRPAALDFPPGRRIRIFVDGQATEWTRFDTQDGCYLIPTGNPPIRQGRTYALVRAGDDYEIRAIGRTEN